MRLVDPELPAARHLVGPDALEVLRVPVEAAGGRLLDARPVQVQYRPGSDAVVRYAATVSWEGGEARTETLAAGTTLHGSYPGAIPVTADTADGRLEAAVWRWPFDPVLAGLAEAVTPSKVALVLHDTDGPLDARRLDVRVVAYRPTVRTVVRIAHAGADEALAYLKVVPPHHAASIVGRHDALAAVGVPVPAARLVDAAGGILRLDPLLGPTMRDLVKVGTEALPVPAEFDALADRLGAADIAGDGPASRLHDGALHAEMLAKVLPAAATRLHRLAGVFRSTPRAPRTGVVHGDLHDAQLVVIDGRIVGVFDLDDVGPGAAIDDRANLIARLCYRLTTETGRADLGDYVEQLFDASRERHGAAALDVHVAAALVGLATGPFRVQSSDWRREVDDVVRVAESLCMRELSE